MIDPLDPVVLMTIAQRFLSEAHLREADIRLDRFVSGDPPFQQPPDQWGGVRLVHLPTGKMGVSSGMRTPAENYLMAACLLVDAVWSAADNAHPTADEAERY